MLESWFVGEGTESIHVARLVVAAVRGVHFEIQSVAGDESEDPLVHEYKPMPPNMRRGATRPEARELLEHVLQEFVGDGHDHGTPLNDDGRATRRVADA